MDERVPALAAVMDVTARRADARAGSIPAPVLAVRDLRISFPAMSRGARDLEVLDGLDLEMGDGEFVAVLGPSGCGKSTLLRALGGLMDPRARVSGEIVVPRDGAGRRATAWMPQRDGLLPWRRALPNAMVGAIAAGIPGERALPRARRLFDEFGLGGFERAWPHELSGGMRQRLALLRTCLAERPVLLLDEPFGGLDPVTRRRMNAWLASVRLTERAADATTRDSTSLAAAPGSGVVLVTHDIDEAMMLADRILVLSDRPGRVVHEERVQAGTHERYDRAALLDALDC
ncbi:ABC transporter ATP-binding protein [Demequina aestuarii]|uniref:ABC transporter ATP-binding protein n=1 Tax=Demequina aestuarii TaxID=327095 RepID=UPI000784DB7A|nr:ATP-binding cassette domain-containing protein [Demequina aestuarii]